MTIIKTLFKILLTLVIGLNMSIDTAYMYKLVVIGDSNCGKTNIITRYTRNEFDEVSRPTIGVESSAS